MARKDGSKSRREHPSEKYYLARKECLLVVGKDSISVIGTRDVLAMLRKIEARGAIELAHKIKQLCSQVFRFAVAAELAERDVTADLLGALSAIPKAHFAAITKLQQVGALMRSIFNCSGHPYASTYARASRLDIAAGHIPHRDAARPLGRPSLTAT